MHGDGSSVGLVIASPALCSELQRPGPGLWGCGCRLHRVHTKCVLGMDSVLEASTECSFCGLLTVLIWRKK